MITAGIVIAVVIIKYQEVVNVKDLGIYLDENFNWDKQVKYINSNFHKTKI